MIRTNLFLKSVVFVLVFICNANSFAQAPKKLSSADILLSLKKLNVLGSVLYVAAHPDDENTRLISYFGNEELMNTGYLSVTRGDGGQNLIGTEIGPALGIIRTQELLEARKVDGGQQFFTRGKDFGFSKHPDETFTIWDKEKVLYDMVWVIRNFQPDIIITRFNTEPGTTHGHHTASAILANEAFEAAADKGKFPDQLKHVDVWQTKKLFWNTSSWFFDKDKFDTTGLVTLDAGKYNPIIGKSYSEIAAESRTMHKSQGFGSSGARGSSKEYLKPLKGHNHNDDIFKGINASWSRVEGGAPIGNILMNAINNYDPAQPEKVVPQLLEANKLMADLPEGHWKQIKSKELQKVLEACLGLYIEVSAHDFSVTPGDSLLLKTEIINRSSATVELKKICYKTISEDSVTQFQLKNNEPLFLQKKIRTPEELSYSHPYWLKEEGSLGMYQVDDLEVIGKPQNEPAMEVAFQLLVNNISIEVIRPVIYKRNDPVRGEQYRPFEIIPPATVNMKDGVIIFASNEPKKLSLVVKAGKANVKGLVSLDLPAGWKSEPGSIPVTIAQKNEEVVVEFKVFPAVKETSHEVLAKVEVDGETYTKSYYSISYDHIPNQIMLYEASSKVVKLDIKTNSKNIGYLMGAGDEVPLSLRQIGYNVTILNENDLSLAKLKAFDAVIIGIRAYNTVDKLRFVQPVLMEYVNQGGNMIVQYNTSGGLVMSEMGPYPFKLGRDRVTVEEAEVRFLKPNHPILNYPNKITSKDFENWVQERGLYFASEWDAKYEPIFSINDPGETPKEGSLLIGKYGKGNFIFTGLSFFRQLPAGVPGAYRLFANMISFGKD